MRDGIIYKCNECYKTFIAPTSKLIPASNSVPREVCPHCESFDFDYLDESEGEML